MGRSGNVLENNQSDDTSDLPVVGPLWDVLMQCSPAFNIYLGPANLPGPQACRQEGSRRLTIPAPVVNFDPSGPRTGKPRVRGSPGDSGEVFYGSVLPLVDVFPVGGDPFRPAFSLHVPSGEANDLDLYPSWSPA